MNFYERAAKLIEGSRAYRPNRPPTGSIKKPGEGNKITTSKDGVKTSDNKDTATPRQRGVKLGSVNASKKKKDDVDEWGSGQAVAQKDKRQADREKEIGQKSVPHKFGRSQKVSPTHPHTSDLHKAGEKKKAEGGDSVNASKKPKKKVTAEVKSGSGDLPGRDSTGAVVGGKPQMTNREETPEETKARKERAANADKVNKANMQPLPDDKPINASKKTKKKVKVKESMDMEQFFGSIYGTISEEQLNEMAMNATKKGKKKKKKKINDEDDDQIERDQADREEDDAKAEDEEEAETDQAVEANTRGSNVDLGDPKNKKHADAKAKAGELAKKAETGQTTTDTGWRDKATGKPTFAPKGTSSLNAAKKGKLKKKVVSAMKEGEDKDWIQKAVDPDHEGYCTPMTKSTCTPKRKALAKTFKKMGKKRDRETKAKDEK